MESIYKIWNKRINGERLFGDLELALLISVAIPAVGFIVSIILEPKSVFVAVFGIWLCASLFWLVVDILAILGCVIYLKVFKVLKEVRGNG